MERSLFSWRLRRLGDPVIWGPSELRWPRGPAEGGDARARGAQSAQMWNWALRSIRVLECSSWSEEPKGAVSWCPECRPGGLRDGPSDVPKRGETLKKHQSPRKSQETYYRAQRRLASCGNEERPTKTRRREAEAGKLTRETFPCCGGEVVSCALAAEGDAPC